MKIAVIAHLKFPIAEPFAGGLEMLTHALVKGLAERGHQMDLFACEGSDRMLNVQRVNMWEVDCSKTKNIPPDHPDFNEAFVHQHHAYMDMLLRIQTGDYDLVHNNSLHYLPTTMARMLPMPMVTTLHTPPFPFIQSAAMGSAAYGNNSFVAVSNHTGTVWKSATGGSATIYNGVDTDFWAFEPEPQTRQAVWFGRICAEKGTHLAMQAAKKAGIFLAFAGPVSNEPYFEKEVKPLMDEEHNQYLGHLTQLEMRAYMQQAGVFLFTSMWEEPFGLVLAEALSCGTPVAAFRSGASPEIIDATCGRIVEKGDVNELATALQSCMDLNRMDCRQRAVKHFSIERMIDDYEAYFQQILKEQEEKRLQARRPQFLDYGVKRSFTTHNPSRMIFSPETR